MSKTDHAAKLIGTLEGVDVHDSIYCVNTPTMRLTYIDSDLYQLHQDGLGKPFWLKVPSAKLDKQNKAINIASTNAEQDQPLGAVTE